MRRLERTASALAPWLALTVAVCFVQSAPLVPLVAYAVVRGVESGVAQELRRGQADLEAGRDLLEAAYRTQDAAVAAAAATKFESSTGHFRAAVRGVGVLGPRLRASAPAFLQAKLDALDAVVDMGTRLAACGLAATRLLAGAGLLGQRRHTTADELTVGLEALRRDLREAAAAASRIDVDDVPAANRPTIAKAQAELGSLVGLADQVWPYLPAVLDLLGFNGPRSYLIEQANPAELRSGGGFIGTVSVVHTDGGRVELKQSVPVEQFDYCDAVGCVHPRPYPWQPGYVAPPPELSGYPLPYYSRLTAWSLEDSGFYPDFASNAALAASFCEKLLGFRPDGVVAVDYYAVAPLLDLTGPLALPKYKITLTSKNFVDVIVNLDLDRDPNHKDVIATAAGLLVARLATLPPSRWTKALAVLGEQFKGRHLQVHVDAPPVVEAARRLGLTDAFAPAGFDDFMLETEDNYGGSKANHFIERRYHLTLSRAGSTLHHELVVDLTDRAPANNRPLGPHYFSYLRLYVPAAATNLVVRSAPSTEYPPIQAPGRRGQEPPPGARLAGGWVFVDVGNGLSGHFQVKFEYDSAWSSAADGQHVLFWQKQPGTVADTVEVTWEVGGSEFTVSGDLASDRLLRLGEDGATLLPAR